MLWEDHNDVCAMLVAMGRAYPPDKWIEERVDEAEAAKFGLLM